MRAFSAFIAGLLLCFLFMDVIAQVPRLSLSDGKIPPAPFSPGVPALPERPKQDGMTGVPHSIPRTSATARTLSTGWEKLTALSEGGPVTDLVVKGSKVYMSAGSELYVSEDDGVHWTLVLSAVPLTFKGYYPNYYYGTDKQILISGNNMLFNNQFSSDGGATWQTIQVNNAALPNYYFSPTVLALSGSDLLLGTYYNGMYKSSDLGNTFTPINQNFPSSYGYYGIAQSFGFTGGMPVVSTPQGIHSFDGTSWIDHTGQGLPWYTGSGLGIYIINGIDFLGAKWIVSTQDGVYYSNDHGANWQKFNLPALPQPKSYYVSWPNWPPVFYNVDVVNNTIYASSERDLYASPDGGVTWTHTTPDVYGAIKHVAQSGNALLMATTAGIYRSTDQGATWKASNTGFERRSFASMVNTGNELLLSSYGNGVSLSDDNGKTWRAANNGITRNNTGFIRKVGQSWYMPSSSNYIYGGVTAAFDVGLSRWSPSYVKWIPDDLNLSVVSMNDVASSPGHIYFLKGSQAQTWEPGLFHSTDNGQSWTRIFTGVFSNGVSIDDEPYSVAADLDTVYVGTTGHGLYKSTDAGATWSPQNNGIDPVDVGTVYKIEKNGRELYLQTDYAFYHSSNWGKDWHRVDLTSSMNDVDAFDIIHFKFIQDRMVFSVVYNVVPKDYTTMQTRFLITTNGTDWQQLGTDVPGYVQDVNVAGGYFYAAGTGLWRFPMNDFETMIYTSSLHDHRGAEVNIPVRVNSFDHLIGTQFSVHWDASVATFEGVDDFGLPGMNAANFNLTTADHGVITFSWTDPALTPRTLTDSSSLFRLKLKLTGAPGDTTRILISGEPVGIQFITDDYALRWYETESGSLTIDSSLTVSGSVYYASRDTLQGSTIVLSGDTDDRIYTSNANTYSKSLRTGESYIISCEKQGNSASGVDVQDVALIRRHILQTELLPSSYAIIAADVDGDHVVSTLDLVYVQAIILGQRTDFPTHRTWTFVPASFTFADAQHPFPYESNVLLTSDSSVVVDFIGMKLGDVNDSFHSSTNGRANTDEVIFEIGNTIAAGDELRVPVRVFDFHEVSAYQFLLAWKADSLTYNGIENAAIAGVFGDQKVTAGSLIVLWDEPGGRSLSLEDGTVLFYLKFKRGASIDAMRTVPLGFAEGKVFDKQVRPLSFTGRTEEFPATGFSFEAYPNPFRQSFTVEIGTSEGRRVELEWISAEGNVVVHRQLTLHAGMNTISSASLQPSEATIPPGLYMLRLRYGRLVIARKVVCH